MKLTAMVAAIGVLASSASPQSEPASSAAARAASASRTTSISPIAPPELEKLLKDLVPLGSEPWETIPWRTDLLAARAESIATSRPLFLWAMNGHPLGCT